MKLGELRELCEDLPPETRIVLLTKGQLMRAINHSEPKDQDPVLLLYGEG